MPPPSSHLFDFLSSIAADLMAECFLLNRYKYIFWKVFKAKYLIHAYSRPSRSKESASLSLSKILSCQSCPPFYVNFILVLAIISI